MEQGFKIQELTELKMPDNYSNILSDLEVSYREADYYWQVGEITKTQGWILHLSAVIYQIANLFETVLPLLVSEKVPFKIARDKETAKYLLHGNLGTVKIGKVVCIYPENDHLAVQLAEKLSRITQSFAGPSIPTDFHLGGAVYVRYGSFNPVILADAKGNIGKYIYDQENNLIPDINYIPFRFPVNIAWPFSSLKPARLVADKKILNIVYKPLSVLKPDTRGNVYKGIYLKGFLRTAPCIIKQGIKNMISEESGRDIRDRLSWQYELYQKIGNVVPLAKVIDFFEDDGNSYLVVEFIKGASLYEWIKDINYNVKSWIDLTTAECLALLNKLIEIGTIVNILHKKGYVHRDIVPANFLLEAGGNLRMIDVELMYSLNMEMPNPPFELGTPGYMSPEQKLVQTPTIKEDIYALGALTITMLIGLAPVKFDPRDRKRLERNLSFFLNDENIASIIAGCLDSDPKKRPTLISFISGLEAYRHKIQVKGQIKDEVTLEGEGLSTQLHNLISKAINGLLNEQIAMLDDIWYTKIVDEENQGSPEQKEYFRCIGLKEGMGGILYMLAKAYQSGFNINSCFKSYQASWSFIDKEFFSSVPDVSPGFYNGSAGVAIAFCKGIASGLISNNETNRKKIQACLSIQPQGLDLTSGAAGQGIALLQTASYLDEDFLQTSLDKVLQLIIDSQQTDGSWLFPDAKKNNKNIKSIGFSTGIPGIIWFLLQYQHRYRNPLVQKSLEKAVIWISRHTDNLKALFKRNSLNKLLGANQESGDERKGLILTFIKAYEVLDRVHFKEAAEDALFRYPEHILKNNFDQNSGLAGLGELYLEAFRVFRNEEWKNRAEWIARVFLNTGYEDQDNAVYWVMDEANAILPDLMVGNAGIIHFLIRCLQPETFSYRLIE